MVLMMVVMNKMKVMMMVTNYLWGVNREFGFPSLFVAACRGSLLIWLSSSLWLCLCNCVCICHHICLCHRFCLFNWSFLYLYFCICLASRSPPPYAFTAVLAFPLQKLSSALQPGLFSPLQCIVAIIGIKVSSCLHMMTVYGLSTSTLSFLQLWPIALPEEIFT